MTNAYTTKPVPDLWASLARESDPSTSHKAAREVAQKIGPVQTEFVRALSQLGTATAAEVAIQATGQRIPHTETVRKRAKECVDAGLCEVAGERACKITGKSAQVYRVTAKGIAHLTP